MNSDGFFNIMGSYRLGQLYLYLIETEFADLLLRLKNKATTDMICLSMNWDRSYGTRFLNMLIDMGFIIKTGLMIAPSKLFTKYCSKSSKYYQGYNIKFENFLVQSWQTLDKALKEGQRIFGKEDKPEEQYHKELELYIRAMDNVASIRAEELFSRLTFPKTGTIIDIAAGPGTFIHEFIDKNPYWQAVHYDLPEVTRLSKTILDEKIKAGHYPKNIKNNIQYKPVNLLEDSFPGDVKSDCLLLSNIIHCYDLTIIEKLFIKCKPILRSNGRLIVHDFFKDNETGALYDTHMMLNTFTGRTYYQKEIMEKMKKAGFVFHTAGQLQSQSVYLCFEQKN